jgi:hypothetical protein
MRTSELTGAALDWAVTKAEGIEVEYIDDSIKQCLLMKPSGSGIFAPSTNWAQGGPIIEREGIQIQRHTSAWIALPPDTEFSEEAYQEGDTPLVAAMRCYVASQLGDEIDIPEELL